MKEGRKKNTRYLFLICLNGRKTRRRQQSVFVFFASKGSLALRSSLWNSMAFEMMKCHEMPIFFCAKIRRHGYGKTRDFDFFFFGWVSKNRN